MSGHRGGASDSVFKALAEALAAPADPDKRESSEGDTHVDLARAERKGVPEVIYAANKHPEQVVRIAETMLAHAGRAIISRADEPLIALLRSSFPVDAVEHRPPATTLVLRRENARPALTGGRIAVITAGTSDLPVAEEAKIVAEEMGCAVELICDVGVAGLHRLIRPLRRILDNEVDVIVVVAGMDGALPSVVAGLVPVPVIGLPTSVGYGLGGGGQAALLSMLQTCAPGLTVVNIDNGVGAGASAALIANALAHARGAK